MQLLILLAMLLTGGNADNLLKEVQPLLKELGGEDIQKNLKQAEELYGIVTALQNMGGKGVPGGNTTVNDGNSAENSSINGGFALAPIADIADGNVISRMTKYIADTP